MIGSWVLVNGEPRKVCSLTNRKAGFRRRASRGLDFYLFEQLQSIYLSEEVLRECVNVNTPEVLIPEHTSVEFINNTVVIKECGEKVDFLQFPNLHTMQSFFLSRYGCTIDFNVERYLFLQQPELVVTKAEMQRLKEKIDEFSVSSVLKTKIDVPLCERLHGLIVRDCISKTTDIDLGKNKSGIQRGMLIYDK